MVNKTHPARDSDTGIRDRIIITLLLSTILSNRLLHSLHPKITDIVCKAVTNLNFSL